MLLVQRHLPAPMLMDCMRGRWTFYWITGPVPVPVVAVAGPYLQICQKLSAIRVIITASGHRLVELHLLLGQLQILSERRELSATVPYDNIMERGCPRSGAAEGKLHCTILGDRCPYSGSGSRPLMLAVSLTSYAVMTSD